MRSDRYTASSTSWVTMRMVAPVRRHTVSRKSCMWRLVRASSAPKGSSSSRTSGSGARARAIATRWRMPPDSSRGRASANSVSDMIPSSSSTRSSRRSFDQLAIWRPNAMFLRTDAHGKSEYPWNTMPRSGPGPTTRSPSTSTTPLDASSRPPMMESSVDLPQPEAPSRQTSSPSPRCRSTPSRATTSLRRLRKVFCTPRTTSFGASTAVGPTAPAVEGCGSIELMTGSRGRRRCAGRGAPGRSRGR
jgi:hypothetical protein